jgi:hypothetical protein
VKNINQINMYYKKRCVALYSFYLEKTSFGKALAKLIKNWFQKTYIVKIHYKRVFYIMMN